MAYDFSIMQSAIRIISRVVDANSMAINTVNTSWDICKNYLNVILQNKDKICKISNGLNSWILEVTGKPKQYFTGSDSAEIFADLYSRLGYTVKWDRDLYKREQEKLIDG